MQLLSSLCKVGQTKILEAKNGLEVLEILERESVQVILMDIQMPEMDGLEATIRIRNHPDSIIRNIPVIGLSANAFPEEIEKARSLGMNDYITKPITKDVLQRKIHMSSVSASRIPDKNAP